MVGGGILRLIHIAEGKRKHLKASYRIAELSSQMWLYQAPEISNQLQVKLTVLPVLPILMYAVIQQVRPNARSMSDLESGYI